MKEIDEQKLKEDIKKWYDENAEHGAFALTEEELDFYFKDRRKTPIW